MVRSSESGTATASMRLLLSRLIPWRPLGRDLFWWMLLVLVALVYATVLQRMLRAKRLIETRGG